MKNIIGIGTLAFVLLCGCATKEPSRDAVTFNMWNENWKRQTTYQLMPDGEETLAELLAREPDVNSTVPIALEPSGLLVHEGKRYAIERDQVVLFGDEGTKIWKRKGIRKELIKSSAKL
jgi:hypothetical protein